MKPIFRFLTACSLLITYCSHSQQVYTADNGITASGTSTNRKVSLGGNLTGNTDIGFNSFNLNYTGTGNIGIRTNSPQAPLHVYKSVSGNFNPVLILEDGLADGYVMFQMRGTGRQYHLGLGNASETFFGLANKFFIWDQTAATARMVLDPNGNFGIGTVTPGNRLSIASATAGTSGLQFTQLNSGSAVTTANGKVLSVDANGHVILVNDAGAGSSWSSTGNSGTAPATNFIGTTDLQRLVFRTNNTERVTILGTGNVGIGTDNPAAKLQVHGTVQVTNPGFTSSFTIEHTANNKIRFINSAIGEFMSAGAGNTVDFASQQITALTRGAYLSNTLSGYSLQTVSGNVALNTTSGNTLIGTTTDNTNKLQVNGTIWSTGLIIPTGAAEGKILTSGPGGNATWQDAAASGWALTGNSPLASAKLGTTNGQDLQIIANDVTQILVGANGSIGIGTTQINTNYKLFVEGSIRTRKVRVDPATWPDYVFHKNYKLPSLAEVDQFIQKNNHLPEIPSAAEVEKNGIELGDNQALLLKKIEELTLYIIDLDKKVEKLSAENKELKKQTADYK